MADNPGFLPGTELPQRCLEDSTLWPLTVTRVTASGLATIAAGGTKQVLPVSPGAIMTLGVNSGVVMGLKGGATDQYLPVFHGSVFPLGGSNQYWLAQQQTSPAADGIVYVLSFETVELAELWKCRLGAVPPQQGAAVSSGASNMMNFNGSVWVPSYGLATADGALLGVNTVQWVNALASAYNGATYDRLRSFAADAESVANPALGLLGVRAFPALYDGANWDRPRGAATNAALAPLDGTAGRATVAAAETFVFDGTNWLLHAGVDNGTGTAARAQVSTGTTAAVSNNATGAVAGADVNFVAACQSVSVQWVSNGTFTAQTEGSWDGGTTWSIIIASAAGKVSGAVDSVTGIAVPRVRTNVTALGTATAVTSRICGAG